MKKLTEGKYTDVTNEQYHRELLGAYSKSDLDAMALSPSNLIQKRNGPRVQSDALSFGQAFHARMEHHANQAEYLKLVAVPPSISRVSKEGKEAHAKFEAENSSKLVLDTKDWDTLENMLGAVCAHPDARSLLVADGVNEETFIWQDRDTGVWCKCRPDKRITRAPQGLPNNMVIDWKTSADCSPHKLQSSIAEYRYHVQAAFYLDGISQVMGHPVGPFVNVFIEKGRSYRVVLGVLEEGAIQVGRDLYKAALARISECEETNVWPGFVDFSLPTWAI